MGRPHIEFIQHQDLPFRYRLASGGGAAPEVGIKRLSVDADTGASTSLLQLPAGWRRDGVGHYRVDHELYVLSGDLTLSGVRYTEHTYGFFPAGSTYAGSFSEDGALVLAFSSGRSLWIDGEAPAGTLDERRQVRHLDLLAEPWAAPVHPQLPGGTGQKGLRRDQATGEETWLAGILPLWTGRTPEKHPVAEEVFLLSGELVGPQGTMRPGAYCWRPPEVWHGPYGSKTGCLMLVRAAGGPLGTTDAETEQRVDWSAGRYDPILPPELAFLREQHLLPV